MGLYLQLFDREAQFVSAFGTVTVESLYRLHRGLKLDSGVEQFATLGTGDSLRRQTVEDPIMHDFSNPVLKQFQKTLYNGVRKVGLIIGDETREQ